MEKKRDPFFLQEKRHKHSGEKKDNNANPKNRHRNANSKSGNQEKQNLLQSKKPFDKKTYRLKKYSKKYKLQQWEEQRKKKLLHNYYKDIKNESLSGTYKAVPFDEDKVDSNQESIGKFVRHPDLIEKEEKSENKQSKLRKDPYWRAKEKFNKMKEDKLAKQKEMENVREEKLRKLQEYKKKKQEKFKKLSRKTKKGQPVMTGRMELLLEKLQKN